MVNNRQLTLHILSILKEDAAVLRDLVDHIKAICTLRSTLDSGLTLREYYEKVGISHETSVARSPQQNSVVERRNRTLIEAARTIRTRRIVETIHVDFDELTAMASEHSNVVAPIMSNSPVLDDSTGLPSSTYVDKEAPSPNYFPQKNTQTGLPRPVTYRTMLKKINHDIEVELLGNDLYFGVLIPEIPFDQSSSSDSIHTIVHPDHQISEHNSKWTKDPMQEELNEFERLEVWELNPIQTKFGDYFEVEFKVKTRRNGRNFEEQTRISCTVVTSKRNLVLSLVTLWHTQWWRISNWLRIKTGKAVRSRALYVVMIGSLRYLTARENAAISSTEAVEYIALSGCCAQILWMRSKLTDYGL
ncbi:retrovirus-related pol polyprotein from transposon TNT 1-94 [Tanacetum coccineum]|uniref:Retrovirus-related pol polyprotein from transposon TNT 1-94 n=1 Tax=Tanacetum coccineum TaxID=301880 RepID=A0ABQ5F7Q3_9ASTR